MTIEDILDTVATQTQNHLPDSYAAINSGGCGLYAKELYKRIKGLEVYQIFYSKSSYVRWYNRLDYTGKYNPVHDYDHFVIGYNGKMYDVKGLLDTSDYTIIKSKFNLTHPEFLKQGRVAVKIAQSDLNFHISNHSWNPTFDWEIGEETFKGIIEDIFDNDIVLKSHAKKRFI